MFLELRHIGTQISSDSYGSIDRSEYIRTFVEYWNDLGDSVLPWYRAAKKPGYNKRFVLKAFFFFFKFLLGLYMLV